MHKPTGKAFQPLNVLKKKKRKTQSPAFSSVSKPSLKDNLFLLLVELIFLSLKQPEKSKTMVNSNYDVY